MDLQDDFADYDGRFVIASSMIEKADEAVSVMNMEWEFESHVLCNKDSNLLYIHHPYPI